MVIQPKYYQRFTFLSFLIISIFSQQCSPATRTVTSPAESYYSINDFTSIVKYDTHVHLNVYDTTFINVARTDNFRLLTVNVNPAYYPPIEEQQSIAIRLTTAFPEQIAYATTFSLDNWDSEGWHLKQLNYLKQSFEKGAIAVKVWKNVGMELRDKNGKFVMIDNPKFDTLFDYLAKNNIPLIGHIGEPKNAWLPLEQMTIKGDQNYFSNNPGYHMYLHPDYPSYDVIMQARDNVLRKHPRLQFIGAHLGSFEWSTEELSRRLDQFPNMAVDMAARISHLQLQAVKEYDKVRNFFIKYGDRLIYATDLGTGATVNAPQLEKRIHDTWLRDWQFFVSDSMMQSPSFDGQFKGLKLSKSVVDKIYRSNAERWFPGINKKRS